MYRDGDINTVRKSIDYHIIHKSVLMQADHLFLFVQGFSFVGMSLLLYICPNLSPPANSHPSTSSVLSLHPLQPSSRSCDS